MSTKVERTLLGALPVLGLAIGLLAAVPGHEAIGEATFTEPGEGVPAGSPFRVDATTDKKVYANAERVRLTVRLLNDSSWSVYVGIGPDEPTFGTPRPGDVEAEPTPGIAIGYVTLTQLGQGPVICTAEMQPDGTVINTCPQPTQYSLSLLGSARVPGHSTQTISTLEITLGGGPWFDPDGHPGTDRPDDDLCLPLEPGYYLLDCHIDGIYGAQTARAQQIIEVRS